MDRNTKRLIVWGLAIACLAVGVWQSRQKTESSAPENAPAASASPAESPAASPSPGASPAASAASAPEASPAAGSAAEPVPAGKPMNLGEFRELTQKTLAELPTTASLHKLKPEEVHETPTLITAAGGALGRIAQIVHDDPSLKNEGLSFYESCYTKDDLPAQIRALCVADHRNLRISQGDQLEWQGSEAKLPSNILDLANEIPADQE